MSIGQQIKIVVFAIIGFIGLYLLLASTVTVQETQRGVVTKFGAVTGVIAPGFHLVNPFITEVHKMNVAAQGLPLEELTYSKDGQTVSVRYVVNYQVDSNAVESIFKEVNLNYENVYIVPKSRQALKEIFSKYTAQGIIDNRGVLSGEITTLLQSYPELNPKGLRITGIAIENIDFDDRYEAAIQNKQVQEQEALAQANITRQEEEKKKQEILRAEALSEKTRLEVQALANAQSEKIIEKIMAEAQLEAAKRWNGVLPTTMIPGGAVPFINVDSTKN